jgi:plasmid stability protein
MASITIRDLDPDLKARLRIRAARHGRAMEEEVRSILRSVLAERDEMPARLGEAIHARFQELGGVDLELPPREPMRDPPAPR